MFNCSGVQVLSPLRKVNTLFCLEIPQNFRLQASILTMILGWFQLNDCTIEQNKGLRSPMLQANQMEEKMFLVP